MIPRPLLVAGLSVVCMVGCTSHSQSQEGTRKLSSPAAKPTKKGSARAPVIYVNAYFLSDGQKIEKMHQQRTALPDSVSTCLKKHLNEQKKVKWRARWSAQDLQKIEQVDTVELTPADKQLKKCLENALNSYVIKGRNRRGVFLVQSTHFEAPKNAQGRPIKSGPVHKLNLKGSGVRRLQKVK